MGWLRFPAVQLILGGGIACVSALIPASPTVSVERGKIDEILSKSTETELNDPVLGECIGNLLDASNGNHCNFDPAKVAGTWSVVHAPHLAFLANFALSKFRPIEYYLTADEKMGASVRYKSFFGDYRGWLSTSGTYSIDPDDDTIVRIIWDKCWWNIGNMDRPTPFSEGHFSDLIQSLGMIGFIEPLSFFPVRYVDDSLCTFTFFGLKITAAKLNEEDSAPVYVSGSGG